LEENIWKVKIVIKKNKHYPWLIPIVLVIWVKRKISTIRTANFLFTDSCLYDLRDEDQWDTNKLFGFSIGHHQHQSSFRFGWRPILKENKIEIVAYEYHNGLRNKIMPICRVTINEWHVFRIIYIPDLGRCYYRINDIEFVNKFCLMKKHGWGYILGVYFGGNKKAPQDIIIHKK